MPCGRNQYGLGGACWACGAGTFTVGTGTAASCEACEFGKFRSNPQSAGCSPCENIGWFAPDARTSVCVRCNTSCSIMDGMQWDRACPGDPTGFFSVCKECAGGLPGNASWNGTRECVYDCLPGFYRSVGGCSACTSSRVCEAGWRLAACTEYADSNCDEACVDAAKPVFHSHWSAGENCPWACDDGYELRVWDYTLFKLRECALVA